MNEKLKPCPFCGESNISVKESPYGGYFAECEWCGAKIGSPNSKDEAKENWNCRPQMKNKSTYSIKFTQEEISEFRHYLNTVKNRQSLDKNIRMAAFNLLHKFPNDIYVKN